MPVPDDPVQAVADDEPPVAGVVEEEVVAAPDDVEGIFFRDRQRDGRLELGLGPGFEEEVGRPPDPEAGQGGKGDFLRGRDPEPVEKGLPEARLGVHGRYYKPILAYFLL